jgi:DNA polymerase III alpha subunit
MKYDSYGQAYTTTSELCDLLYVKPDLNINLFQVEDPDEFNQSVAALHAELEPVMPYVSQSGIDVDEFDLTLQSHWRMPKEYQELDIAEYILGLCQEEYELQRVGQELLLYQERNLFNLLRYLKYLIDTLRKNNLVWGVGRGSSVASYVLFLLGVHKINSIYYDLSVDEFLK